MHPTRLPPPITPLVDLLSVSTVPGAARPDSSSSSLSKRRLKRKQRSKGNMDPVELTLLADGEVVGPGPVGNRLGPGEMVTVLNHLCLYLVVRLGIEEACVRAK
ncbi:hypothetical protein NHX12_011913 [Muraenolepis orangiensis]|uniref:Uncharacterized protein n=1 Tax=Muraenolepis orangiensis TaxID=630683 RepID=A0A9Q0DJV3_9TELE|nr:hypothetical protein NHX12_011913 [Muraenolepis orangiensis]